jgi:hypothetical protein
MYKLGCAINRLRNKEGTGHGRPFLSNGETDCDRGHRPTVRHSHSLHANQEPPQLSVMIAAASGHVPRVPARS